MNELKPEDVMRALEHCATEAKCDGCVLENTPHCECELMEATIALLREKDAEIDRLYRTMDTMILESKEKDAEIEKWQNSFEKEYVCVEHLTRRLETARAEAITDFAKELTSELIKGGIYPVFVKGAIERTEKKLKGETDGKSDL